MLNERGENSELKLIYIKIYNLISIILHFIFLSFFNLLDSVKLYLKYIVYNIF